MPYSAKAIANYFLDLAREDGEALTPMKLQKLVYFAHGWHLAVADQPLVNCAVQAWKFGPVIPSLYHDVKQFGMGPVTEKIHGYKLDDAEIKKFVPSIGDRNDPEGNTRALLKKVWETYSRFTAIQLSNLTHEKGSPWDQVNQECGGSLPKGRVIPDTAIRDYFLAKAKQ